MLIRHHSNPATIEWEKDHRDAMKRLGFEADQAGLRRYPVNAATRKGNLAEIVLAEYLVAARGVLLPVYRLRYNPNVDQSMKGDDVLAFDLDASPVRIVVGEAKFREVSSAAAVKEIVEGLERSFKAGLPASLQFVANRLFESGDADLGRRILDCARLFALGDLSIDYVGMLLSDSKAAKRIDDNTPGILHRLAMVSLGVEGPESLVSSCYEGLD